jgi:hypothetical protein
VTGSNLGRGKSPDDASNYATTLASRSLPSHDSLIIQSFNTVQSDFLETSLNKPQRKRKITEAQSADVM